MARRIEDVDRAALRAARDRVGVTLRWKYDAVTVARTPEARAPDALEAWVAEVQDAWGCCGKAVWIDDELAGYVLCAPPTMLPGLGDVPTAPPSPDAVVLAELCVLAGTPDDPDTADPALAKVLVQALVKDLFLREVAALEAFGTHGEGDRCLVPVHLLDAVGFTTHRAHSATPRMRLDLRTARTWMNEVELALERLVGAVRPAIKPAMKPGFRSPALRPETPVVRSGPRAP